MIDFQNVGFVGALIFLCSYIPQVVHLIKKKNSAGVSAVSWIMGIVGLIVLFAYAVYREDVVFMPLLFIELIVTILTLILVIKYKPKND